MELNEWEVNVVSELERTFNVKKDEINARCKGAEE